MKLHKQRMFGELQDKQFPGMEIIQEWDIFKFW